MTKSYGFFQSLSDGGTEPPWGKGEEDSFIVERGMNFFFFLFFDPIKELSDIFDSRLSSLNEIVEIGDTRLLSTLDQ